jgi:hypothetical protein
VLAPILIVRSRRVLFVTITAAFVAVVLSVVALTKRVRLGVRVERYALHALPYAIGTLAAFWRT